MVALSFLAGLLILQYLTLLVLLTVNWKNHRNQSDFTPKVSVLVAARNEAKDIPKLLKSLENLDYPAHQLEILLANDQSTDQTGQIISEWVKKAENRKLISIPLETLPGVQKNGKANALAILAKVASGEYYFFTDADCEVPTQWIKEGIQCFDPEIGIVLGITQVKSVNFFGKMQEIDWWNTLGIVKSVTDLGLPTTGLGNNMATSRAAYEKSGGFENIPFSLTEDLELSKSIRSAGYKIRHQVSNAVLVKTKAEKDLISLLKQRKRWMAGAMTLSFSWKLVLVLQFLFFPALVGLLTSSWTLACFIFGAKVAFQSAFLFLFAKKAGQQIKLLPLLVFDFYQVWNLSLTILYYFWPGPIEWKARTYP